MAPLMMQLQASGRPCPCRSAPARRQQLRRMCAVAEGAAAAAPAEAPKKERRVSPLEAGGTLKGAEAAGKDAGAVAKSTVLGAAEATQKVLALEDGRFVDYRWTEGRWDLAKFSSAGGKMDWDAWNKARPACTGVIDAEMARRKLLEESPIPSTNEEPVFFDTAEIPWWAWVRRFHLPEAEKLNGRAAMVGYFLAYFVDQLTGFGLADQQNSFLGKLALHLVVFAVLIFRTSSTIPAYKNLLDEATFYDKQWAATWEGQARPSETEKP